MTEIKADLDEVRSSQLPFVEMLLSLGYKYISRDEVMAERGGDGSKFLLKNIAAKALMEINDYEYYGQRYKFSEKDVRDAVEELESIPLEGLVDTSKTIFHMIMPTTGGKTIKVMQGGKSISKSFKYIDFEHFDQNQFHVTVEYEATGKSKIRPDIVCFVNGIPFVVIENKKPSVSIDVAMDQMLRNQQVEYCPRFFIYPQLLIASNGSEIRYGTTLTPKKFYALWREKGLSDEEMERYTRDYIEKPLKPELYNTICEDLQVFGKTKRETSRLATEQDKGVVALLEPKRLLDLTKNFILYDAGVKKIMRYQQYFAIAKMLLRVEEREGLRRRGGLLWHTQGSGKSLTMVMFVKALIEHPKIQNPRVIIVTDRKDLDKQIADTFRNCGLKKGVVKAKSGQHLLELVREKNLNVITTLVHKFDSVAKKRNEFVDEDENVFVLVDEAHRTQSGIANLEMNRILPNACYIGFTGTPLMTKERESWRKFGGYIDRYTIDDARRDQIILDLIYEGRFVDLVENRTQIDKRVERLLDGLDENSKKELQQLVNTKIIKDNPQRIADIAEDIEKHFCAQFQGTGLKAQVVAPSKFSAVLMQKTFELSGKVRSALVISGENGIVDEDDAHKKEVIAYLEQSKAKYQSLESYEKEVIESFKHSDEGIEIIIVVDKLLTGFDAPRNTVLYLARDLKDHGLLQAIARVNRLFDNKKLPKTVGFIIDYSENAKNLDTAMKLFGNYDADDVQGALIDVKEKVAELEQSYAEVHDLFKAVENKKDAEAYLRHLGGKNDADGEQKRKEFYEALNIFLKHFNECLALQEFVKEFQHIEQYKKDIKKMLEIRRAASLRYADKIDLSKYKHSLVNILDRYVDSQGVELLTKQINITDTEQFEEAVASLGSDKSKAEAIAANVEKTISEKYDSDPEFYQKFSDKIHDILKKMREGKLADIEALRQMKMTSTAVLEKKDEDLPDEISGDRGADIYYRNLKPLFEKYDVGETAYVAIVIDLFHLLEEETIVDWHKNDEVKRRIANRIDDYVYDVLIGEKEIKLTPEESKWLVDQTLALSEHNHDLF